MTTLSRRALARLKECGRKEAREILTAAVGLYDLAMADGDHAVAADWMAVVREAATRVLTEMA